MVGSVGATATQSTVLNNIQRVNRSLGQTTERLATGRRINRASDDPSGSIAAEQLRGDLIEFTAQAKADSGNRLAQSQAIAAASALSKVEDADYARETSDAIKGQILADISLKMLSVANRIEAEKISLVSGFSAVA